LIVLGPVAYCTYMNGVFVVLWYLYYSVILFIGYCRFFLQCFDTVLREEWHPARKNFGVDLLVVMIDI